MRVPDRDLQRDCTAVAEAEQIGLANVQMFEQGCGIVRRLLKAEGSVSNVGRVAIALLLECYHLPVARQLGQNIAKGGSDRVAPAVQKHQRGPL